jgi:chemotaxis protein CheD
MIDIQTDRQHFLLSGSIFVQQEAFAVTTVLGSCVSVCLWDPVKKIGGINHYMLPLWNGEGLASPKYGSIAIPKMIERMLALGTAKTNLQAKIFGGGDMFGVTQASMQVGERNIILAWDVLETERIRVVGSDVGGKTGRKIIYNTGTGGVLVKRLTKQIDDIKV